MTSYKGWEVTIKMKNDDASPGDEYENFTVVGKAESISFEVNANLTSVYGVGYRDAQVIKEGQREVSGSLEHMFVDADFYDGIAEDTYQNEYQIRAEVGGNTVTLSGVKFDTWSLDAPQDDFLVESIDFNATSATWS